MPQPCPNGPRTPTTAPTGTVHSAWVVAPTSRTECSIPPDVPVDPAMETATSPTPNTVSMLNCPWA